MNVLSAVKRYHRTIRLRRKQPHISKLISVYETFLRSVHKTNPHTKHKTSRCTFHNSSHNYINPFSSQSTKAIHTQTSNKKIRRVSPFNTTNVKRAHKTRTCWYFVKFITTRLKKNKRRIIIIKPSSRNRFTTASSYYCCN